MQSMDLPAHLFSDEPSTARVRSRTRITPTMQSMDLSAHLFSDEPTTLPNLLYTFPHFLLLLLLLFKGASAVTRALMGGYIKDLTISKGMNGALSTTIYSKSSATTSLLLASSHHPRSLVNGIPTGQCLTLRRNCREDSDCEEQAFDMTNSFLERGYSQKVIKRAYKRAKHQQRSELITDKPKAPEKRIVRIIGTYNNQWDRTKDILQKHWHILLHDCDIRAVLLTHPAMDLTISKGMNGALSTTIYSKSSATTSLLLASSIHPRSLVNGIPTAQCLTLRRNCREDSDCEEQAVDMANRFLERGYSSIAVVLGLNHLGKEKYIYNNNYLSIFYI
ncbi:uncharacterized protein LOC142492565 [Ascaphus truei]|uniref:uncharacterized protein LOC142492565 n=1 Tax=Ascaphus truei TaxID=8439 RepID=UPI003F5A819D